ncbi:MAG: 4Fe-4S binding protein [Dehalococcoidales bacterium]|nr:4Fe-4S binding protein [Dehalococcoidales bacterium]
MILVDESRCSGCLICAEECPTGAIQVANRLAVVGEGCSHCQLCIKLCPKGALRIKQDATEARAKCTACPVECEILEGYWGACQRYKNLNGRLILRSPLVVPEQAGPRHQTVLDPLITGIGAGTTSPCYEPAPYVVEEKRGDVDVVTVVSEVPLSYSGIKVKIDTNLTIGEEGSVVRRQGRAIGRVTTEEYGSKMLSLGGVNVVHGKGGSTAIRTIVDLINRGEVELRVENGPSLKLRVGERPIIDGKVSDKMRVGCGSAAAAMFAPYFKEVADEVIVLDPGITGLFSEHQAGRSIGMVWSGITPLGIKSTIGRYFGHSGGGLGGTNVKTARDAVASIDMRVARPGMTVLITDTAGETGTMFRVTADGDLEEIPLTPEAQKVVGLIQENCEESRVSAIYMAGVGGSARSGVTKFPIKLTRAVHAGLVRLTVAGSPAFVLPGGGITFGIDVERIPVGAVTWVPTPATVAPIEYTMPREVYEQIEGHLEKIRSRQEVLREREIRWLKDH